MALASSNASKTRPPAVAGSFYPGRRRDLEQLVTSYYELASHTPSPSNVRAIIVPHAGYMYSGEVAAHGYAALPEGIRRFFILAANHSRTTSAFTFALPGVEWFETPIGDVRVSDVARELENNSLFTVQKEAHSSHIIEVQLPFLQRKYEEFEIVPIVTGNAGPSDIMTAADLISGYLDDQTAIIVSSDLSHYHAYEKAKALDHAALRAFEDRDTDAARLAEACGLPAVLILLNIARAQGWNAKTLKYQNSGDVSHDRSRVVGYGAVSFY